MLDRRVLEGLTRLGDACGRFIPLTDLPKTRETSDPSSKEYVVLSKGISLGEASISSFRDPLTNLVKRSVKEARFFSLLKFSEEIGVIHYDRSLGLAGILMLLQTDGEGVIGYSEDFSFSFYLDYDKTGCVIEIECPKNLLN